MGSPVTTCPVLQLSPVSPRLVCRPIYLNALASFWFARRMDMILARTVAIGMPISFMSICMKFVIRRSSQFHNTQSTWQPLWWGGNVWCFIVVEAIRHANRKLPIIQIWNRLADSYRGLRGRTMSKNVILRKTRCKVSITAKKSEILIHNVILCRYVPSPILNYIL